MSTSHNSSTTTSSSSNNDSNGTISEKTKIPIKMVIGIVTLSLAIASSWWSIHSDIRNIQTTLNTMASEDLKIGQFQNWVLHAELANKTNNVVWPDVSKNIN